MIRTITNDLGWLMTLMTQKDCTTLKKLIVENPDAPLLIFAGEYAHCGEYRYESVPSGEAFFEESNKDGNKRLNKDEFGAVPRGDMANDE